MRKGLHGSDSRLVGGTRVTYAPDSGWELYFDKYDDDLSEFYYLAQKFVGYGEDRIVSVFHFVCVSSRCL